MLKVALTLDDLPPPPPLKIGWPWTEQSQPLPAQMLDGADWLRMSIVTPSYNQNQFIEETIRSVLLQGYPNLEYIIIDGGSTDGSIEIIQKYEKFLTYWVSEPDKGQSHALNKGVERITGEIFTFINSDDMLRPNTLVKVATNFSQQPSTCVLYGGHIEIDKDGKLIQEFTHPGTIYWEDLALGRTYQPQPGTFWRTQAFLLTGNFRENLHYFFDQEFFIRLLMHYNLSTTKDLFACNRIYSQTKTQANTLALSREKHDIILEFLPKTKESLVTKLLAYRSVKINHVVTLVMEQRPNLLQKLILIGQCPITLTSIQSVKFIILGMNKNIDSRKI